MIAYDVPAPKAHEIVVKMEASPINPSDMWPMFGPANLSKAVLSDEEEGVRIKSPIIGTAYMAPEPGAKQFIQVGDKIKKGQTILIVEAMKTMNHVPATSEGVVKSILVKDGQPVEFGQTLILLK